MPKLETKAIDVACPKCSVEVGVYCKDNFFCQARINLAAKITRQANQLARCKR